MADDSSSDECVVQPRARPIVDSDSSEDESAARVTPASKQLPPSTPIRTATAKESDDDSEDKVPRKPPPKEQNLTFKAKAAVTLRTDSDDSSSEDEVTSKSTAKAVTKPVATHDSEDSSDDEDVAAKPKAKAAPVSAVVARDSEDSSDEGEVAAKPLAKAIAGPLLDGDASSSEEEVTAKPKAKAIPRPVVETDSEDDSPPARIVPRAAAKDLDDDSDDEVTVASKVQSTGKPEVEDSSDGETAPARLGSKAQQAAAEDSDDFDDEDEAAKGTQKKQSKGQDMKAKAKLDASVEEPKGNSSQNVKQKGQDDIDDLRVIAKGLPFKVKENDVRQYFSSCGDIKHVKMLADEKGLSRGVAFITFATSAGVKGALQRNGDKDQYKGRTLSVEKALKRAMGQGPDVQKNKKRKQNKQHDGKIRSGEGGSSASTADTNTIVNQELIQKMLRLQEVKDFSSLEQMGAKIVKLAQSAQQVAREQQSARKKRLENTIFVKGLPVKDFNEDAFQRRFQDCGTIKFAWMPLKSDGETKGFGTIAFKTEDAFQKALQYNGTKCKGNVLSVVKSEPLKPTVSLNATDIKQRAEAQVAERSSKRKTSSTEDEIAGKQAKKKLKHAAEAIVDEPLRKGESEHKSKALNEKKPTDQKDEAPRKKDQSERKSKASNESMEKLAHEEVAVNKKTKKDKAAK